MSLNRNIDDWFLGYKTRAVKGKGGVPALAVQLRGVELPDFVGLHQTQVGLGADLQAPRTRWHTRMRLAQNFCRAMRHCRHRLQWAESFFSPPLQGQAEQ